ncbi:MAG: hypothetical protein SAJ12_03595, partial [Jaaginema sp. PMC 1079.18]|nr:hypothetical protein [Jaaginema sp. PMC 1079.18]
MANYQIYIKSTTLDQTGIHWRKAEDNERCEPPKLLLERCVPKEDGNMGTVNYMIDTNAPSLILVRHQNQLLIQVTGLYSEARSDQKGRKVFNTLVLQGEDNEDNEKLFCSLAISALDFISRHHNNLEQKIDESVQFDGKDKFKINVEKISSFIDRLKTKY